ncbi:MAG: hypothetical protein JRF72_07650 [Deltaproteobacteria bacterium]|jgi:hypothetical protein|nr:hypothetical protein [Deltaproteobacteria bacterium]
MRYSIASADYKIALDKQKARGEVTITGRVISGEPDLIPLFGNELVIEDLAMVSGGSLLCSREQDNKIFFVPDANKDFQIRVAFSTAVKEDNSSRFISVSIPQALQNSLTLALAAEISLVEAPGIKNSDATYHFSSRTMLTIRFSDKAAVAAVPVVEIDALSVFRLQGSQAIINTTFAPVQPITTGFNLQIPANTTYVSSTLKSSWINKQDKHSFRINLPAGSSDKFSIQFALDETQTAGNYKFVLPEIKDNTGSQGNFIVEQPDGGQVSLSRPKLASRVPVARLNSKLRRAAGRHRFFMKLAPQENISLSVKRFKTVSTASVVLDSVSFFTSLDDNGNVLSVLIMDVPPEAGPRLSMQTIAGAKIWSLTVNGQKSNVYTERNDAAGKAGAETWIIPLARGEFSHVELAFIRQDQKPGLQGKFETELPASGLPATRVRIGIALPERLQLLSLDGPVSPAAENRWKKPREFIGTPYYFTRAFYAGDGLKLILSYKEPAN